MKRKRFKHTEETKNKIREKRLFWLQEHPNWKPDGKTLAAKRWEDHIKVEGKQGRNLSEVSLLKKRFYNQRYKARKREARGEHSFEEWLMIKSILWNNTCADCGRSELEVKLTEDHIVPLSLGGSDFISNIQPLCVQCNTRKHAKFILFLPLLYKNHEGEGRVNIYA